MTASESVSVTFATADESGALASVSRSLHRRDMPALVGPDGEQIALPLNVSEVLKDVVDAMQQGKGISVVPRDMNMTTQQAADFLGVSRPTLVGLLENGQIEFTKPGRHRRYVSRTLTRSSDVRHSNVVRPSMSCLERRRRDLL